MTNTYSYGQDNLLKTFNISKERTVSYVYDDLNRLKDLTISTTTPINIHYYYADSARSGYSTTKIYEEEIGDTVYRYEYDIVGNITKISEVLSDDSTITLYSYTYDKLNELTEVYDYTNRAKHSYTYNTNGNMTKEVITYYDSSSVAISSTTIRYAYSDTNWKDKLTNYNGQALTYDAIGNPLTYRDGMTMTWKNGRQLATLQDDENDITYNYDSNSVRISKNVNGVEYTYTYLNGMLVYETRGEAKFYYSYDSNGILYSIKYTLTDTSDTLTYYCTHNSRGDIIGIYNYQGTLRAKYEYDAWGNILSITDADGNAITSATHVGNLNPFRYRGYYYDSETGLYYLMSRYYDPVTHRFLNADTENILSKNSASIENTNLFSYCDNNPITRVDDCGDFWNVVIGAVVGGLVSGGIEIVGQIISGKGFSELDWGAIAIEATTGMATGALASCGIPPVAVCVGNGVIGAANSVAHSVKNGDDFGTTVTKAAINGLSDFAISSIKPIAQSATYGKHLKLGKVGTTVKTLSNSKVDHVEVVKTVTRTVVNNTTQKVTAPTKNTQRYCRACGRPIGNQYSWQCSNPSYY